MELTLVFEPVSAGEPPSWTGEGVLVLNQANDPQGQTQVDVAPAALDAEGKATVLAAFPPHASSGFFFAKFTASDPAHGGSWEGWASFQADPGTCRHLELDVTFIGGGANDGGVPADAGPCQDGLPGVNVFFEGAPGPVGDSRLEIRVGAAARRFDLPWEGHPDDAAPRAVAFPYPSGTLPGPGSVDYYYPGPGVINTVGHAAFLADPSACVVVPLTLTQAIFFDDAGVADAAP